MEEQRRRGRQKAFTTLPIATQTDALVGHYLTNEPLFVWHRRHQVSKQYFPRISMVKFFAKKNAFNLMTWLLGLTMFYYCPQSFSGGGLYS